ncbi:MAG: hypothetical protein C0591_13025 [Marinilabiliales bacterium]|nr:MAG: hypothetical protein C0591_13025 [Marinilabiliales bacterium]
MKLDNANKIFLSISIANIIMLLSGCVDKYWPESEFKYDRMIVVEGMITNTPGPYTVYLSVSAGLDKPEFIPLSGYSVIISDDQGNMELLTQIEPGVYMTSADGIQGVIGRSYKLGIFSYDDNNIYESAYELLRKPVEIEDVYSDIEFHTDSDYEYNLSGYQFYVDTKTAEQDTNYLLWQMDYTYQYEANYLARYVYDNYQMETMHPSDSLLTCWKTGKRKEIITNKTENLSEPTLKKIPLCYITTETKELSIRYSLLVKQHTISYEAYRFWNQLEEFKEDTYWLYAKQPYPIKGNLECTSDGDEIILGYFMVAGVDEKRVFVDRPLGVDWHYKTDCGFYTGEYMTYKLHLLHDSWPVYLTKYWNGFNYITALPQEQYCVDCRQSGGELTPPEFWIE